MTIPDLARGGKQLRDVDRALIQAVMFQLGILPMESTELDMRRILQEFTFDEARAFRRKFRKVWRQSMRASLAARGEPTTRSQEQQEERLKRTLGVGKQVPSRAERNARKKLVFDRLWKEAIDPMLQRFDNPDNKKKNADSPDSGAASAKKKGT